MAYEPGLLQAKEALRVALSKLKDKKGKQFVDILCVVCKDAEAGDSSWNWQVWVHDASGKEHHLPIGIDICENCFAALSEEQCLIDAELEMYPDADWIDKGG